MFDTWNVFGICWFPPISPALVSPYMVRYLPCGGGRTSLTTLAGSPLLTHSWNGGWDCVVPKNLFTGVPLSAKKHLFPRCHFVKKTCWDRFRKTPIFSLSRDTGSQGAGPCSALWVFAFSLASFIPHPEADAQKACPSPLVCISWWQGIGCFCKISVNSIPVGRAISFLPDVIRESFVCFLLF